MNKDYLLFHRPFISDEEINEMVDTLRSGWLSMGPKTLKFEQEFNSYIGSKKSIAVNSWTAAGHLTLEAFSVVTDGGEFIREANITDFAQSDYACGMFTLTKKA